jgi:ATP phosphoribosyltransferase
MLTLAIAKGRILEEASELFRKAGFNADAWTKESRKLIHEVPEDGMRVMIVRATDVPVYVEHGAADIGIVGRDTVLEQDSDLYEPLDLGIGKCRLSVARPKNAGPEPTPLKVATKYAHLAEKFFAGKGKQVELVKLYGSIELAPLTGLSDCIVDLVSTGKTLLENGLEETEKIMDISTVLVVNRASLKTQSEAVKSLLERLRPVCEAVKS